MNINEFSSSLVKALCNVHCEQCTVQLSSVAVSPLSPFSGILRTVTKWGNAQAVPCSLLLYTTVKCEVECSVVQYSKVECRPQKLWLGSGGYQCRWSSCKPWEWEQGSCCLPAFLPAWTLLIICSFLMLWFKLEGPPMLPTTLLTCPPL